MTQKKLFDFLHKNIWITVLLILSVTGATLGVCGFREQGYTYLESFYKTLQLFVLNVSFGEGGIQITCLLQWARWLIFAATLWAAYRFIIEILAPQYIINLKIRAYYRNHIVICGLNKITINLIEKLKDKQILVLSEEKNEYAETLKTKGVYLLIGDFLDETFLKDAKLRSTSTLYVITDNDKKNMEIMQSAFSVLEKTNRKEALKCFTLINDRKLKNVLEGSALFKQKSDFFDASLFNINEMGIKYGIAMNIDKIIPSKIETVPEILLVGLTERTEIAMLNLVHCLTMKQESFNFTIVEEDKGKIQLFQKRNAYLFEENFAKIKFVNEIESKKQFDSIIICLDNPIEAIEKVAEIRCSLGEDNKDEYILILCNEANTFNMVLKEEWEKKKIFVINLFGEIANYVFKLDEDIEGKAKEAHNYWDKKYNKNKPIPWETLSGHFKQSNRNQILDNYLRFYIARNEKFDAHRNCLVPFSDNEEKTLAMMEHRRWMLEKFDNGWRLGKRNDELKLHDCLRSWEKLSIEQQAKDYDAIVLMIKLLNNQIIYKKQETMKPYTPQPIDTSKVKLSPDLLELTELLARNTHEVWATQRLVQGWKYGAERNDAEKLHPCLVAYEDLPESEKEYDRSTAMETLKVIKKLGFEINNRVK